jgi:hypothetical protein
MTEFMPQSRWSDTPSTASPDFWESSRPAPIQEANASRPSLRAQRRPAPALAADVNELLESMARKRVPRLDAVRERVVQARTGMELDGIEQALRSLLAATTALDFLAGRSGGEQSSDFLQQGEALVAAMQALGDLVVPFVERHGSEAPVARLVWIDLVLESGSLHKRVRQGAHWLAEMDQDLLARRKGPNTDVTLRAIEQLALRSMAMHEKLQTAHRLCRQARAVHTLCERIAAERSDLCTQLQDAVLPACRELEQALQPLLHAAAYRALVPTELIGAIDARHTLEVALTQATALVAHLRAGEQDIASQLADMADKARQLG